MTDVRQKTRCRVKKAVHFLPRLTGSLPAALLVWPLAWFCGALPAQAESPPAPDSLAHSSGNDLPELGGNAQDDAAREK